MVPRGLQNLKKCYQKCNASWLGIWNPLGTNLGGFYGQVGRLVGAKLAYLGGLILSYPTLTYQILGGAGWSCLTLVILGILGILDTRVRPSVEGRGQHRLLGNTPKSSPRAPKTLPKMPPGHPNASISSSSK